MPLSNVMDTLRFGMKSPEEQTRLVKSAFDERVSKRKAELAKHHATQSPLRPPPKAPLVPFKSLLTRYDDLRSGLLREASSNPKLKVFVAEVKSGVEHSVPLPPPVEKQAVKEIQSAQLPVQVIFQNVDIPSNLCEAGTLAPANYERGITMLEDKKGALFYYTEDITKSKTARKGKRALVFCDTKEEARTSGTMYNPEGRDPILCRTGTKKDIAWYLIERFPEEARKHYVEAFFGGGAIFWQKRPSERETLNEFNPQVKDFYDRLQEGWDTGVNLLPTLTYYNESVAKYDAVHGDLAWVKRLMKHYPNPYISKTIIHLEAITGRKRGEKPNPNQMLEIDRIGRVVIGFLKENPVKVKVERFYNEDYTLLDRAVSNANSNLICLYWYLFAHCCAQSNTTIPLEDLQCLTASPHNLVMSKEDPNEGKEDEDEDEVADDSNTTRRKIVPTMPIKKSADPFSKLGGEEGKWYQERIKNATIIQGDALDLMEVGGDKGVDSPDTFFMLDPPYEQGGAYGVVSTSRGNGYRGGATKEEKARISAEKKAQREKDKLEKARLSAENKAQKEKAKLEKNIQKGALDESVFPYTKFADKCSRLKGKWFVTINGSKNILELFRKQPIPIYGVKAWVKNKTGATYRFEIFYANYPFKDGTNIKSKAFDDAPEYLIGSKSQKTITPITYKTKMLPYEDNIANVIGLPAGATLKPKFEKKTDVKQHPHPCVAPTKANGEYVRILPISDSVLPLLTAVAPKAKAPPKEKAPPKAKKPRAPRKAKAPKNEIIQARGYGLVGGYYTPYNPRHFGSTYAYSPSRIQGDDINILTQPEYSSF